MVTKTVIYCQSCDRSSCPLCRTLCCCLCRLFSSLSCTGLHTNYVAKTFPPRFAVPSRCGRSQQLPPSVAVPEVKRPLLLISGSPGTALRFARKLDQKCRQQERVWRIMFEWILFSEPLGVTAALPKQAFQQQCTLWGCDPNQKHSGKTQLHRSTKIQTTIFFFFFLV